MICPFCKRLIHPNSYSCQYCGAFVRDDTPSSSPFERQEEEASQRAGDRGEEWLLSVFGVYREARQVLLFAQKRIPAGSQRREIDLLALTPKRLYVFEVKNWSGTLSQEGTTWVQTRRNGKRNVQKNLIDDTRDKAQALRQYLQTKDIDIPPEHVSYKVFLVNENLNIDRTIARQNDVLYPARFRRRVNAETIIDYCLSQDAKDTILSELFDTDRETLLRNLVSELHKLRTWDRLYLYGQPCYKGDIQRIQIGNVAYAPEDFASGLTIDVHWRQDEDETNRLLSQLLKVKPGTITIADGVKYPVDVHDTVLFHRPGQQQPALISFEKIEKIVVG